MKAIRSIFRVVLLFFLTFGIYGVWLVGRILIPNKVYWRQLIFELWAKGFVRIAAIKIEVIGEPPQPPFFLVSNHVGYMDIPVIRSLAKGVFVAKHDIGDWPLLGRMILNMGIIYVDRGRRRTIPGAGKKVIERLNSGEGVIVFPEGTSTKGEEVLPFNSSFLEFAAQTDTPVSHCSITYRSDDEGVRPSDWICWWDDTPFFKHLVRYFRIPSFVAVVNFGAEPIVDPERKKLAAKLHDRVSRSFIPMT